MGSIAVSQLQCPWFRLKLALLSVWNFTYSPCVSLGFLQLFQFPIMAGMWIDYAKLALGVNESVNICLHGAVR